MRSAWLRDAIVALVFVVVFGVCFVVARRPSKRASRLGLRGMKRAAALEAGGAWVHVEPLVRWLGVQTSRFLSDAFRDALDQRLTLAGDVLGLTADEYAATAVLTGLLGLAAGAAAGFALPTVGSLPVLAMPAFGALVPSLLLDARIRERQTRIRRGLPYVLDLLSLSLGAGSDFAGAVQLVVEKARSNEDVREELGYFLQQLHVGHSRAAALRELARRVPIGPARELTLAVEQAEERGNSIVATLEVQAKASRGARSNEAELAAERANTRMVFPVMGFMGVGLYFVFTSLSWFERGITSTLSGGGG